MGLFNRKKNEPAPTPAEVPTGPKPFGNRPLRLQAPPTIENMPLFASQAARALSDIDNYEVTYSPADLAVVDKVIDDMRAEGMGSDDLAETLWTMGALVGEVIVHTDGGRWIDVPAEQSRMFSYPYLIELQNGNTINPLGKVFKRMDNGPEDALVNFYEVLVLGRR